MYNSLLNNKKLINYIEKNNIHIDFVLHKNLKKYKEKFYTYSNNITINNNKDINIQDLFNKSDFLITDYSSLFFDMAYRHKPILYYQFDYEKFREMHYKEGYFSYERDGFGPVVYTEDKLIKSIIKYCDNKFVTEDKYLNRMINFFPKRDKYNSYRIVREVEKMLDKN
jgi:CDP-glycerol glycerophosphotransferase (TagB/SpsB family)